MEAEIQKYEKIITKTKDGKVVVAGERPIGGVQKFEFGAPDDEMSRTIGGGYLSNQNPDFMQRELGKDGTVARFYFDRHFLVDVGNPDAKITKQKRKIAFQHGFGYLCIPVGFEKSLAKLKILYQAAVDEYYQYEKLHPRPAEVQDVIIADEKGNLRRALLTPMDIKVGGGVKGNVEMQKRELMQAAKLTKKEKRHMKLRTKLRRKIRECLETGAPLRNPFIGKNKRLYNIRYAVQG